MDPMTTTTHPTTTIKDPMTMYPKTTYPTRMYPMTTDPTTMDPTTIIPTTTDPMTRNAFCNYRLLSGVSLFLRRSHVVYTVSSNRKLIHFEKKLYYRGILVILVMLQILLEKN